MVIKTKSGEVIVLKQNAETLVYEMHILSMDQTLFDKNEIVIELDSDHIKELSLELHKLSVTAV